MNTPALRRVVFVNRFYWPDEPATAQLLTDLAEGLAAEGWAVSVIASHPGRPGVPGCEQRNGVSIHRVRGPRWGRHSLLGRMADFAAFLVGASWRCVRVLHRGDTLVTKTDPPLLGVILWPWARLCRARQIHWVQDIYPEVAMAVTAGRASLWLLASLRGVRDFTWRHSAGCVALGDDMAAFIRARGVEGSHISIIGNWAPTGLALAPTAEVAALRRDWGLGDKFVIAYSGNLGRVHDLDPVLDLAGLLRDEPHIAFLFIGGGAQHARLRQRALDEQLRNVHFQPAQPRDRLAAALGVGDLHLVTLLPSCASLVFPSKLYGVAALGKPILFLGPDDSEPARLVRAYGMGIACHREAIAEVAATVRLLARNPVALAKYGAAADAFAQTAGASRIALARWQEKFAAPHP